jgi:hypothetical protein
MPASDYYADACLDAVLSGSAYPTHGSDLYLALCTAMITGSDTGSTITEPSGGGYARLAVTRDTTNWPDARPRVNGVEFDFGTTTGSWGTLTYWALCSASTAGNIIWYGPLTESRVVGTGQPVKIPAGDLSLNIRSAELP